MSMTMKFFQPDERYLNSLAGLARVGNEQRDYLVKGVEQLIAKARKAPEITQRNRYVIDALGLLAGTWRKDFEPDVFDPSLISAEIARLPKAMPNAEMVLSTAESVRDSTWASFDAFAASSEGQRQFDPERIEDVQGFLDWFRLYRPYIVLGIPEAEDEAEAEVRRRIEWMVAKIAPSEEQDPAGLRASVLDMAWEFARRKYFQAQLAQEDHSELIPDKMP